MRLPSSTMRLRTSCLTRPRTAALSSFSRPSNSGASSATMASVAASVAALRSAFGTMRATSAMRSEPTELTRSNTSLP